MEKDEFVNDDFLRDLVRRSPLDSPSDDFVDRVMAGIQPAPEASVAKKPFMLIMKASVPYAIIAMILLVIISTSDLPLFNWLPGKDYFLHNLVPYLGSLLAVFKNAFASKYVSWVVLISFSAGVLFTIDRLFSRRTSV
jgi:hypothetical protein